MYAFLKCKRCDWIDYLSSDNNRCPKCGSRTEPGERVFGKETLSCNVMDMRGQWKKASVTFEMLERKFKEIMGDDIKIMFPDPYHRYKLVFMMKAYLWVLLKTEPNLWTHVDVPINGLKELMTLRMQKPKGLEEPRETH